jgi:hypothetical protein
MIAKVEYIVNRKEVCDQAVFRFLASPAGRLVRTVVGLVLIVVGIAVVGGLSAGSWPSSA